MASYHLTAKIGTKGKATAHASYIAREGKYSDNARYEDLEHSASGNMPKWAEHNAQHFWQAADENERANGSVYREIEIALPRELNPSQRLELVNEFIQQELGDKHAYQFAIHNPKAALEKNEQPHAHIMYSERIIDGIERDPDHYFKRHNSKNPEKGGCKKFSGGKRADELKNELLALRESWAKIQNKHLEKNGHTERVDHRSLEAQGIDKIPEIHLGASGVRNATKGDKKALLELRAANTENQKTKAEVINIFDHQKKQADAFKNAPIDSVKKYPDLAGAAAVYIAIERKAEQDRLTKEQITLVMEKVVQNLANNIERGNIPEVKIREQQVSKEAQANEKLKEFVDQVREKWRQEETAWHHQEAKKHKEKHKALTSQEPKEPLIFGRKEWKLNHDAWVDELNSIKRDFDTHKQAAKDTQEGKSTNERHQNFFAIAHDRLKKEHPELALALKEAEDKKRAEAMEKMRERERQKKEKRQDRDRGRSR